MRKINNTYLNRSSELYLMVYLMFIAFSVSSCTVKLAPSFNKEIVTGITSANKDAMEFFASVEDGTTTSTFVANREDKYNKLIGAFDALSSQIKARPVPSNKIKDKVNEVLKKHGAAVLTGSDYPSADALNNVLDNLKKMKGLDKKANIGSGAIAPFKNAIVTSIDQALTYENFLDR